YTDMISLGGQRQLTANMSVNLDFVHAASKDILMNVDLNPGTRATTSPSSTLTRTNTAVFGTSSAIQRVNAGHTTYNALEFQLDLNRNGARPDPLPAGQHSPTEAPRASTIGAPANPYPVFNRGGRNGARGPDFLQADMRLGYDIPVHGSTLQVFGEIFNLTNR